MATDIERPWSVPADDDTLPQIPVKVDYSQGIEETYYGFALACILTGRVCYLLQAVVEHSCSSHASTWPSWVSTCIMSILVRILILPGS